MNLHSYYQTERKGSVHVRRDRTRSLSMLLAAFVLFFSASVASAQDFGITLSRSADFSTTERQFDVGETVFVKVTAPEIDATDLEVNELRVSGTSDQNSDATFTWRMSLKNNLDGTYTAELDSLGHGIWYLRAAIADSKGAAFEGDATFVVGDVHNPVDIRAEGRISELGDGFLVILNRRIFVNSDTHIFLANGETGEFRDLQVGDRVVVLFSVSFTGELIAKRINVKPDTDEVSLRGRIQEIGDDKLVVLNRIVEVDSATTIFDEFGQHIRFGQLAVGDLVGIKGTVAASGIILAMVIQREDSHVDEIELVGVIQQIREGSLFVLGKHIGVDSNTEIFSKDGEQIRLSDLRVGMIVAILAFVDETDQYELQAKKIKVVEDGRIVVEGEIQELGERELVVESIPFRVVADTEIVTAAGLELNFGDLEVGWRVMVYATAVNTSDMLVALRIVVLRPSIDVNTITGFIARIGGDLVVVNDHAITVVDRTEIFDKDGTEIRFGDLEVGMRVRIRAVSLNRDLTNLRFLIAERIQVLEQRERRVVGRIRDVSETHIVIASVNAAITSETKIVDRNGDPIGTDELTVGALAAMHVVQTANGIVATAIRLLPRLEDEIGVAGILEAVEDSAVVVLGQTFQVLPNTVARNANGERIAYTDLEVGLPVALRGELLAGGTLVALHIQQFKAEVRGIKALGPIESVGSSTIEVIGIHFFVDGDTKIYDLNRNEVALSDMEVGQTVLIGAEGQSNGTRLAKMVQVQDVVISSGDLSLATDGSVNVLGVRYELAPDAMIITDNNVTVEGGGLVDGMFVEIRGSQVDEGVFTITKVKVLSGQSVGVDNQDVPDFASDVRLFGNYPNPFSSTTTIEFDVVDSGSDGHTTLAVFDLTGRQVRTLLSSTLLPGTHTATWDGRDDSGTPVASGLYLYQVRTTTSTATKTMMLVR